uniref:DNA primase large subunit C-terminal domain-containing protein n=1 Tax=Piliocolobus tephrosceles TaxID=591936 RepID=A0A8C9GBS6_9PRIM
MIIRKRLNNNSLGNTKKANEKKLQNITIKNYEINMNGHKTTFFDYYSCMLPYDMPISLYKYPPIFGYCSLNDFQELGAKRLALLQFLDTCTLAGGGEEDSHEYGSKKGDKTFYAKNVNTNDSNNVVESKNKQIKQKIYEYKFGMQDIKQYDKEEMENIIMTDLISHYILRIAFSKDKEKQHWFLKQELKLFTFRLNSLKNIKILNPQETEIEPGLIYLLKRENLNYDYITKPYEASGIIRGTIVSNATGNTTNLMSTSGGFKNGTSNTISSTNSANTSVSKDEWKNYTAFIPNNDAIEKIFKIPFFPDAYFLVRDHKVYVHQAIAYVPDIYLDGILLTHFRINIRESFKYLEQNEKLITQVQNDSRISDFLSALPKAYVAKDFRHDYEHTDDTRLMPQTLYNVYKHSFPPCMRRIFINYLKEKHLKHWARQQLWLFFKGAGMTLEENIQTNRSLWSQPDKFDKEHRYTIRHMYGKEGKKTDYSPYNCTRIINNFPVP